MPIGFDSPHSIHVNWRTREFRSRVWEFRCRLCASGRAAPATGSARTEMTAFSRSDGMFPRNAGTRAVPPSKPADRTPENVGTRTARFPYLWVPCGRRAKLPLTSSLRLLGLFGSCRSFSPRAVALRPFADKTRTSQARRPGARRSLTVTEVGSRAASGRRSGPLRPPIGTTQHAENMSAPWTRPPRLSPPAAPARPSLLLPQK